MPEPTPTEYAAAARAKKRAEAESIGIDGAYISALVEDFYDRVRIDPLLGPIFDERVQDWPHHLGQMKAFWRSILHNSGEYSGNPMQKHMAIPGLDSAHFSRWLELFYATLRELDQTIAGNGSALAEVAGKARNIAASLLLAGVRKGDGLERFNAEKELPNVS